MLKGLNENNVICGIELNISSNEVSFALSFYLAIFIWSYNLRPNKQQVISFNHTSSVPRNICTESSLVLYEINVFQS